MRRGISSVASTRHCACASTASVAELRARGSVLWLAFAPLARDATAEGSILDRARALGPGEVEDALLDLEGDALVRWLAEPARRS
ncbi:hypothetical protein [Sorangium cellulosum]|uniref:Uncharacterized protein n=1 Tax=Sorangium cellulosum TaxID=56 RepID=A0A150Q5D5_SORCE|nr:hypothetical protein [Sorangium cellulosum]KYF63160.1 hypothetical protein BE15_41265 [Sorangium cellulosum]